MSKSQSKEFFKKKQRGRTKRTSLGGAVSTGGPTISNAPVTKLVPLQTSMGSASGLLGGEDPAVVVINPHPPILNQNKDKRTKICCLL